MSTKAKREILESMVLVEYLIAHGLSFDDIRNFSDNSVRTAMEWKEHK